MLLEELCLRGFPYSYDKSNGTTRTVQDISGKYSAYDFAEACDITFKKTARYRKLLVNYFETQNYIFVHSWIVVNKVGIDTYEYRKDWRNSSDEEWENAMWVNGINMALNDLNKTGIIVEKRCSFCKIQLLNPDGSKELNPQNNKPVIVNHTYAQFKKKQ